VCLHVIEAGRADGELIILLHGFPEFWRGWSKQIAPLAEAGFRVVAPDQRGYNLSEKPPGVSAYHIDCLAQDILGLLAAYDQKQAIIAGHDWGAAVAWQIVTDYPEAVKKLIILNVPHPAVMAQVLRRSLKQLLKSWYIFFFQVPRLPEWILSRDNCAAMRRIMLASSNPGSFSEQDLDAYVQAWSQPKALTAMLNWYRAMFRSSVRSLGRSAQPQAIKVRPPTLLIWGARDVALSSELVQPSLALCEAARLVYYEEATHWVQHDLPSQVTQEMLSFIA
jgi:pimeloyl-ACP methyl ester carboxylesterase